MRILIYDGSLNPSTFIRFLAENIVKEGHTVFLAGKSKRLSSRKDKSGVYLIPVSTTGYLRGFAAFIVSLVRIIYLHPSKLGFIIKQTLKKRSLSQKLSKFVFLSGIYAVKPDIIHIQWATHIAVFRDIIKRGDIKFVVSFRGRMINISPFVDDEVAALYRELFPDIDGFHAVSESILKNACLFGADERKAKIVYPAVKDQMFYTEKVKTNFKEPDAPLRILSVGRQHWKKGYTLALDVCRKLKDKGVDFIYTIIAGGDKEELIYNIYDLGLEKNVKLIDRLPHDEVLNAYRQSHLFLLPSFEEGVANVALEAMAIGVPVISTNCGGMEELIINEKNGWLVPVRETDALVSAVENFLTVPENKIRMMVSEARLTVEHKHLQSLQTKRMIELYHSV
jgi:colanic acid/amylovoran biosynthesis glycosyltransferase